MKWVSIVWSRYGIKRPSTTIHCYIKREMSHCYITLLFILAPVDRYIKCIPKIAVLWIYWAQHCFKIQVLTSFLLPSVYFSVSGIKIVCDHDNFCSEKFWKGDNLSKYSNGRYIDKLLNLVTAYLCFVQRSSIIYQSRYFMVKHWIICIKMFLIKYVHLDYFVFLEVIFQLFVSFPIFQNVKTTFPCSGYSI